MKNININQPYYTQIKLNKKTIEGRLNKPKFSNIKVGDILSVNNEIKIKIIAKRIYKSFHEMIKTEGIKKVIPNAKTITQAVDVYSQFYTKKDEAEFGVVAFEVEVIGYPPEALRLPLDGISPLAKKKNPSILLRVL